MFVEFFESQFTVQRTWTRYWAYRKDVRERLEQNPKPARLSKFRKSPLSSDVNSHGMSERILVIGAGGFGSCLADHLGSSHPHQVFLYSRSEEVVEAFNRTHKNIKYLKGQRGASHVVGTRIEIYPTIYRSCVLVADYCRRAFASRQRVHTSDRDHRLCDSDAVVAVRCRSPRLGKVNNAQIDPDCSAILRQLDLTNVSPLPLLVFVNKGIEIGTNQLPLEVRIRSLGALSSRD